MIKDVLIDIQLFFVFYIMEWLFVLIFLSQYN